MLPKGGSTVDIRPGDIEIYLTKGYVALISAADIALADHKWCATECGGKIYAKNWRLGYLHRAIVQPNPGLVVDHRNGNGLDCRRFNLRACTHQRNSQNSYHFGRIEYRGVSRDRSGFRARISTSEGERLYVGYYKSAEAAAKAYDEKARELFGEFAWVNFRDDETLDPQPELQAEIPF